MALATPARDRRPAYVVASVLSRRRVCPIATVEELANVQCFVPGRRSATVIGGRLSRMPIVGWPVPDAPRQGERRHSLCGE